MAMAARRRGWVTPIIPRASGRARCASLGSWVVAAARIAADNRDGTLAERLNQFVRVRGNGQFWRDSQAIHAENYSKMGGLEV